MRALFDTSVLVAGLVEAHPAHAGAFRWLSRALKKEFEFYVCAHSLLELYAVLTRMPLQPRITPGTARRMMRVNIETRATIVTLTKADYLAVVGEVGDFGLLGGVVYDALIARCARKTSCDVLLTLNEGDFQRVWPDHGGAVRKP